MVCVVFWHVLFYWIRVVFVRRSMAMIAWVLRLSFVVLVRAVGICVILLVSFAPPVSHEVVQLVVFVLPRQAVGLRLVGMVRILVLIERVAGRTPVVWLNGLE